MQPAVDRFELANQLFVQALELPHVDRDQFVCQAAGDDTRLRDSVLKLLTRFDDLGDFLDRPVAHLSVSPSGEFEPGVLLAGRFRVLEQIGRGGMGEVYRAEDQTLGETVALKTVRLEWRADASMLARFRDEIKLARRVAHPNVCRIFDLFTVERSSGQQTAFFTMEYLAGKSLADALRSEGHFAPAETVRIAEGIAAGLDAAHRKGIVHRDLKPANIILADAAARPVITDFGLAKLLEAPSDSATQSGMIIGSPDYMAPEQFLGDSPSPAVDIFALGLIVYEMVSGTRPYPDESLVRAAVRRITADPIPLCLAAPSAPAYWEVVLRRALARDPKKRHLSAAALVSELRAPGSLTTAALSRISGLRHSRRSVLIGGFATLSLAAADGFWRLYSWSPPEAPVIMFTPVQSAANPQAARSLDVQIERGILQSAHVRTLPSAKILEAWRRMARSAALPRRFEPAEAREVAMRAGANYVLLPELTWANEEWVLKMKLELLGNSVTRPRSEQIEHFYAPGESGLIAAGAKAAEWIRRAAGEASKDVLARSRPPEEVTTSSWEALKEFTEALDAWRDRPTDRESPPDLRAEGHLVRALEIDPQFALAASTLADIQVASREFDQGLLNYERAALLIDQRNLTDRESLMIRGMFALDSGQYPKAQEVFSRYAQEFPAEGLPLFHQARAVECQGNKEAALRLLDLAVKKEPGVYSFVLARGIRYLFVGRFADAELDCARAAQWNPSDWTDQTRSALAFAHRDMAEVWRALERMRSSGSVAFRGKALALEACMRAEQNRLDDAQSLLEDALGSDHAANQPASSQVLKRELLAGVFLRQRRWSEARDICRRIIEAKLGIRPTLEAGALLAMTGEIRAAQECLPKGLANDPPQVVPQSAPPGVAQQFFEWPTYWRRILRLWAEIALATGRPETAFGLMAAAPPPEGSQEWPDTLVRASIASGEHRTAERLLGELFANPASYWIAADASPPGFMRQAIGQAQTLAMPATVWSPLDKLLDQPN